MKKKILLITILMSISLLNYGRKVFILKNDIYIEKVINIENKSINDITKYLGYNTDQVYTYYNFNSSVKEISTVIFKIFTDEIICAITDDSVEKLNNDRVKKYLSEFNSKKEFSSYVIESTLNDGIKNKSLTAEFLAEVLKLETPEPNGTIYAPSIGYKIEFEQGTIKKFYSSDGLNKWAKEWKSEQPELYKLYKNTAARYWGSNIVKIINEINIQADAWANTPEGFQNEYLNLHRNEDGTFNFKMLLVAHYNIPITLHLFKEINYGRYQLSSEFTTIDGYKRTTYKINKSLYTFSEDGKLISSYTSE